MSTWLDHIPDDLKPKRWPNLKEAASRGFMGQTAIIGRRPWLVVGFDGTMYELEAENGERMRSNKFEVIDHQSDNNRLVASSRIDDSPLARGMKLADCGCTIDRLKFNEDGEWNVETKNGEELDIARYIEELDAADWKVEGTVQVEADYGDGHQVTPRGYDDVDAQCPDCGSNNVGPDAYEGIDWICNDCGYVGNEREFTDEGGDFEPDATQVGIGRPYEEDDDYYSSWQYEGGVVTGASGEEQISDREDNPDSPLKCPKCGSHTVEYTNLQEGDKSDFRCLSCGKKFKHEVTVNEKKSAAFQVQDSNGRNLEAGAYYNLHGDKYRIPDTIRIMEIKDGMIVAKVDDNPHPIKISADDIVKQGYSFEPLPQRTSNEQHFWVTASPFYPDATPGQDFAPGQNQGDSGFVDDPTYGDEMAGREMMEPGAPAGPPTQVEQLQTPSGGTLFVETLGGRITGWTVPGPDGGPDAQFIQKDLDKVQQMYDAQNQSIPTAPEQNYMPEADPSGLDQGGYSTEDPNARPAPNSTGYLSDYYSSKEGGKPVPKAPMDTLFGDVIKALGYKHLSIEDGDKIRNFIETSLPIDGMEANSIQPDQYRELVSKLAADYLRQSVDADVSGELTLNDMGIPPEGEDYYRTAAEGAPVLDEEQIEQLSNEVEEAKAGGHPGHLLSRVMDAFRTPVRGEGALTMATILASIANHYGLVHLGANTSKESRRKFSPSEQKGFIEEEGSARNLHKLRLEDSHYVDDDKESSDDPDFLW